MKTTTTPDTLDHLLPLAWAAGRVIIRDLLIPLLALLVTLATLHREPTLQRLEKATAPLALQPASAPALETLKVSELRQLARTAGHKSLARSGRRQQLLEVLG